MNLLIYRNILSFQTLIVGVRMEFIVKVGQPEKQKTSCLLLGIHEPSRLSFTADKLDKITEGELKALAKQGDIKGKLHQTRLFTPHAAISAERLLFLGLGKENALTDYQYREAISKIIATISESGAQELVLFLADIPVQDRDVNWRIRQAVQSIYHNLYRFEAFKGKKNPDVPALKRIVFLVSNKPELLSAQRACEEGIAIAEGTELTKELANTPANICTPTYLAAQAKQLAKKHPKISTAVLEEKEIAALKMGSFLSVTHGSNTPAKLITLEYRGSRKDQKPIVLVGKGITFDTGGNSLKPPSGMIGMKYDMCGAATVLGVFKAVSELELPIHLIGVIPSCENMPGPDATRPDDIVTSMSGQTIEILNTDAEGRLILADALTYCERFHPACVIDIATLTGACYVVFGSQSSALMANHQPLADALLQASRKSGDRTWQLPLFDEYGDVLKSEAADLSNIASFDAGAGTIVAASFLSKFATKFHWAHIDIANVACQFVGPKRNATGRPVSLLVQFLIDSVN